MSLPELSPGRGSAQSQRTCEKSLWATRGGWHMTNPMCLVHSVCPAPLAGVSGGSSTRASPPTPAWSSTPPSAWCIIGLQKDLLRKQGNWMSCASGVGEYLEVSGCPHGQSLRDAADPGAGGEWLSRLVVGAGCLSHREGYGRVKCTTGKGPPWWEVPCVSSLPGSKLKWSCNFPLSFLPPLFSPALFPHRREPSMGQAWRRAGPSPGGTLCPASGSRGQKSGRCEQRAGGENCSQIMEDFV